ncbi:MAG: GNAT family N-acetyltransferase [Chloroflexi bacterium]|nr:GNAT family N-acetyltransferase [Chloroflexota bacterium]
MAHQQKMNLRLFRWEDLSAVVEVVNRAADIDQADEHYDETSFREEIESNCAPEQHCFVATTDQGQIVGYAYVEWRSDEDWLWGYAWGAVHPDFRRQGVGRQLFRAADADFIARVAAEEVGDRAVFIQRFVQSTKPGEVALALSEGYSELRSSYRMSNSLDQPLSPATMPPGFSLRPFDVDRDAQAVYEVDQAAFMDGGGQPVRTPYDEWCKHFIDADYFDPSLIIVALDDSSGAVAGVAITHSWGSDHPEWAWIAHLGVLSPYRGRRLGEALLRQSFYASQQRGFGIAVLGVRADNPSALTLYTRAGMQLYCTFTHYRKMLRGDPAAVQS